IDSKRRRLCDEASGEIAALIDLWRNVADSEPSEVGESNDLLTKPSLPGSRRRIDRHERLAAPERSAERLVHDYSRFSLKITGGHGDLRRGVSPQQQAGRPQCESAQRVVDHS